MDSRIDLVREIREIIAEWHKKRIVEAWDEGFSAGFYNEEYAADGQEEWDESQAKASLEEFLRL